MKIERQDVKGNYQVKTDKKGHYFYGGLPLGNYKITVVVDGQDRGFQTGRTKVGETVDVSFNLAGENAPARDNDANRGLTAAEKAEQEKKDKANSAAMAKNKALNDAFNAGKSAMRRTIGTARSTALARPPKWTPPACSVGQPGGFLLRRAKTKTGADQTPILRRLPKATRRHWPLSPTTPPITTIMHWSWRRKRSMTTPRPSSPRPLRPIRPTRVSIISTWALFS